jgi:glycosyltransferase involved in cell wall biosynthesis
MARILLLSDAGATTGFGRVSHSIGDRLVEQYGHDIHVIAVNYDGDAWPTPMKLYLPTKHRPNDFFGQSRFVEMLGNIMPDVVWIIHDPWQTLKYLLRNRFDEALMLARARPVIAYMPVDGTNQPPAWADIGSLIKDIPPVAGGSGPAFYPVAMSQHGQRFLKGSSLIYHGIDHELYRPVSEEHPITTSTGQVVTTKAECREIFQIPTDAFLVLRVDRNSYRKNFGDTWRALVPVMEKHDDVFAWFHCKAEGDQLDLGQLFSRAPHVADRFRVPGKFDTKHGWSESDLVALYNAADVFVSTSWGEGFGLTLGEAAACGLPIIAQNVSSIPEVVGPGGLLLKPERLTAVDAGQDQWLPDVRKFSLAIEQLYANPRQRQTLGEAGRAHVVANFSWDTAARQFHELITRVTQENPVIPALEGETDDAEQDPFDDFPDPG